MTRDSPLSQLSYLFHQPSAIFSGSKNRPGDPAFASYYANRMMVGPAMSPYVNTTTFGGYADVRFSSIFGANVGVRAI